MSSTSFDTVWPADTVEFVPRHDDLLVLGTYLLREATEDTPMSRVGELMLLRVVDDEVAVLQRFELGAVLDIKWRNNIPAVATADGTVAFFKNANDALSRLSDVSTAPNGVLCLAIDWSSEGTLAVSHSDGSVALVDTSTAAVMDSWAACGNEAWAVAWDAFDPSVLFSGGDDCMWKTWDVRAPHRTPAFASRRRDAGVTTVASHPHMPHLLAVGSYDGTVCTFDTRTPRTPLHTADVGGGAWRVRWHPSPARRDDALVACMHDGVKLVRAGEVVRRFDEHASLAYGADWGRAGGNGESVVASCSFYDHTLKIWRT